MKIPKTEYPAVFAVPLIVVTIPCFVVGTIFAFARVGFISGMNGVHNILFAEQKKRMIEERKREKEEALNEMTEHIKSALSQNDGVDPDKIVVQHIPHDHERND